MTTTDDEEDLTSILRDISKEMKTPRKNRRRKKTQVDELISIINRLSNGPEIIGYFNSLPAEQRQTLLRTINSFGDSLTAHSPLLIRILESKSVEARMEMLRRYFTPGSSPEKNNQWIENVLQIPFSKFSAKITEKELRESRGLLDQAVYGHDDAKHKILSYIAQLVRNQESGGLILGLKSYPGVGKTNLVDAGVSKILKRPFFSTSLGGVHDSSYLRGFQYTYEGSEPGYIARCIIQGGVMNPVLFFDELDKVSQTAQGDEIINTLIQLTDPIQSKVFQDRYFGSSILFDLSRCIFVFAYNDSVPLNSILKDRITEIQLHGFSPAEKFIISKQYLIPKITRDVGLLSDEQHQHVWMTDPCIKRIIDLYSNEAGVRQVKRVLQEIFMEINLLSMLGINITECNLMNMEQFIKTYKPNIIEMTDKNPALGRVNGLFVDGLGRSGISPIEAVWIPSAKRMTYEMRCTGNLGKIMGESIQVAWSVAWNLIETHKQQEWINRWEPSGGGLAGRSSCKSEDPSSSTLIPQHHQSSPIQHQDGGSLRKQEIPHGCLHIHCRDSSSPKDGPSAGVALTILMWSMLTSTPISQEYAYTGEISLHGDLLPIGGLTEKIIGASRAGCRYIVFPKANQDDLPSNIPEGLELLPMTNIHDVIEFLRN